GGTAALLVLLSPAARWAAGHPLTEEQRIDPREPYRLAAQLPQRASAGPRRGYTWPYWWGDYPVWRLPGGGPVFWYSRPEAFMPVQGQAVLGPDPSADDWRNLLDHHALELLVVQKGATAGLWAYLDRLPREAPARSLAALLAARTPW